MSAITKPPAIRRPSINTSGKGKPLRKPNAVRQIMEREQRAREQSAAAARAASTAAVSTSTTIVRGSGQCPNKACPNPNVVDGTCQTCGRVADESNIVSEVQFGETSSGAAVVQGSYLGADQGGVRISGGPAFRRVAGSGAGEAREKSLKEAKTQMQNWALRLNVPPSVTESGFRLYRMASMNNFTQGRKVQNVIAMCLYAACRKEGIHKVMLIDLADLAKENVFRLGRNFKAFQTKFPETRDGPMPVILEDLIYKFASKLEFFGESNKIALSAVRIAKRMQADHMTHGRRPAGICAASVIMAARAHSFRRTVREVVYIAKVTEHTIQQRMDEFANVPSAQMTIDEFHTNEFLDEQFNPPAWYKNTAAWKEKHPGRKRKSNEVEDDDADDSSTAEQTADKRQRLSDTQDSTPSASHNSSVGPNETTSATVPVDPAILPSPSPSPGPSSQPQANPPPNTDKDGFVIPPLPGKATERVVGGEERAAIVAARGGDGELNMLAEEFGGPDAIPERSTEAAMAAAQGIIMPALTGKKHVPGKENGQGKKPADRGDNLAFDEEWRADEAELENMVETYLHDQELVSAAVEAVREDPDGDSRGVTLLEEFANEQRIDHEVSTALHKGQPVGPLLGTASAAVPTDSQPLNTAPSTTGYASKSRIKDDPIVTEDEFADDPEVQHCMLDPLEAKMKAQIWTNENEDWMRERQIKEHKKKLAAKGPPKKTRNRQRVARIGEGQASPASSAGEAAAAQLKARQVSKKFDYDKLKMASLFKDDYHRTESAYGGSTASRATSRAASVAPSDAASEADGANDYATTINDATQKTDSGKDKENVGNRKAAEAPDATSKGDGDGDGAEEEEEADDQTGYDDKDDYPEEIDPFADNAGGIEDEW